MRYWLVALMLVLVIVGSGCAAAEPDAASSSQSGVISSGGVDRSYIVHVPPVLAQPLSLVINLHGGGGTAEGQARLTGYDAVADSNGFLVVYPQGIDKNWADGRGATQPDRNGVDDVQFISDVIDRLISEYGVSPERIFVTGMSNGAFMAERLACDLSTKIAAIAAVAGTQGRDLSCAPVNPVSVMQVHGTEDPIVPYFGGTMLGRGGFSDIIGAEQAEMRWREINNCTSTSETPVQDLEPDGTSVIVRTSMGCSAGAEVKFYKVLGGGHSWPGGSQYLLNILVGSISQELFTSTVSWDFFARHPKPSR
ncbi:MAG: extracellular catalytic domain type 1 short-chain-length polyhydroxyalkanoate depolymerase [Mycobacteriaceae bacterium]